MDGKKSADKILGHQIRRHDLLEWMVTYQELRDILCYLKKVSPNDFQDVVQRFKQIQPAIEKPEEAGQKSPARIEVGDIVVEIQILGKERKPRKYSLICLFFSSSSIRKLSQIGSS